MIFDSPSSKRGQASLLELLHSTREGGCAEAWSSTSVDKIPGANSDDRCSGRLIDARSRLTDVQGCSGPTH